MRLKEVSFVEDPSNLYIRKELKGKDSMLNGSVANFQTHTVRWNR